MHCHRVCDYSSLNVHWNAMTLLVVCVCYLYSITVSTCITMSACTTM